MFQAYKEYLKRFKDYKGKSTRSDYWWVFLANAIIFFILTNIKTLIAGSIVAKTGVTDVAKAQKMIVQLSNEPKGSFLAILVIIEIVGLLILIPSFSLTARRVTDTGFPWWFAIVSLVYGIVGLLAPFIKVDSLSFISIVLFGLNLVVYILCIFPSKKTKTDSDGLIF